MIIYKVTYKTDLWADGCSKDTDIESVTVATKDMTTAIERAKKYAAKSRHNFEAHTETYEGKSHVYQYKNFRVTECVIVAESEI